MKFSRFDGTYDPLRDRLSCLALYALINFLPMYADFFGGLDTQPHLVPLHAQHGQRDVVANHQHLTDSSGQDEHGLLPRVQSFVVVFPRSTLGALDRSRRTDSRFIAAAASIARSRSISPRFLAMGERPGD